MMTTEQARGICRCDGSGFYVRCIDDICRGVGECIHGDGMAMCPCEGDSAPDDDYDEPESTGRRMMNKEK